MAYTSGTLPWSPNAEGTVAVSKTKQAEVRRGGKGQGWHGPAPIKNGCRHWHDCFSCPFPDCIAAAKSAPEPE